MSPSKKYALFLSGLFFLSTFAHANELDFTGFLDPKKPRLSDNPASVAQLPGDYFEGNVPIIYSINNVNRQKKYYGDFYNGKYDTQFKNENTVIWGGSLATRNVALTYKRNYSQFKTDNNSNSYLNISEEIYDEESMGYAIGNIFVKKIFLNFA